MNVSGNRAGDHSTFIINNAASDDQQLACLQRFRTCEYEQQKNRNPWRLDNTCRWFLGHPNYRQWLDEPGPGILWVSADPGCGKSVLARSLVDLDLERKRERTVCYFFFKEDGVQQASLNTALCAILHQLFTQRRDLLHHALDRFETDGTQLYGSVNNLWAVLQSAINDPSAGEIVCIFDALDECETSDRHQIINLLNDHFRRPPIGIVRTHPMNRWKVLVTSRPYQHIERRFHRSSTIRLRGEHESRAISEEIGIVIEAKTEELALQLDLEEPEKASLLTSLQSVNHRTYLWLRLIFAEMLDDTFQPTRANLRRITRELPKSIDEAYEAMLARSTDAAKARRVLHMILAAVEPLTQEQLRFAIALDQSQQSVDDVDLIAKAGFETAIKSLCGLFITISDGRVYLVHQTARDFLLSQGQSNHAWKQSFKLIDSENTMISVCLHHVVLHGMRLCASHNAMYRHWDPESGQEDDRDKYRSWARMVDYSLAHWSAHCKRGGEGLHQSSRNAVLTLFAWPNSLFRVLLGCERTARDGHLFRSAWETIFEHWSIFSSSIDGDIAKASYFGLRSLADQILTQTEGEQYVTDKQIYCAGILALARGHTSILQLLFMRRRIQLESGSLKREVMPPTGAYFRLATILELLLSLPHDDCMPALEAVEAATTGAMYGGSDLDILELSLISEQTESTPNRFPGPPRTTLTRSSRDAAFLRRDLAALEVQLRDPRCDLNRRNHNLDTLLAQAISWTQWEVARLLLKTGRCELNAQNRQGQTALILAATIGRHVKPPFQMLNDEPDDEQGPWIEQKKHDNSSNRFWTTNYKLGGPFTETEDETSIEDESLALGGPALKWVILLLKAGVCDIDIPDIRGRTALSYSAQMGRWSVMRLLLTVGNSQLHLEDSQGKTPLDYFSDWLHITLAEASEFTYPAFDALEDC